MDNSVYDYNNDLTMSAVAILDLDDSMHAVHAKILENISPESSYNTLNDVFVSNDKIILILKFIKEI